MPTRKDLNEVIDNYALAYAEYDKDFNSISLAANKDQALSAVNELLDRIQLAPPEPYSASDCKATDITSAALLVRGFHWNELTKQWRRGDDFRGQAGWHLYNLSYSQIICYHAEHCYEFSKRRGDKLGRAIETLAELDRYLVKEA